MSLCLWTNLQQTVYCLTSYTLGSFDAIFFFFFLYYFQISQKVNNILFLLFLKMLSNPWVSDAQLSQYNIIGLNPKWKINQSPKKNKGEKLETFEYANIPRYIICTLFTAKHKSDTVHTRAPLTRNPIGGNQILK